MVEHLDDLEVLSVGQREHHVACAEPRVDAPSMKLLAEQLRQPLGGADETVGSGCERRCGRGAWQLIVDALGSRPVGGVARYAW